MSWEKDKDEITQRYFQAINENNLQLFGIIKENLSEMKPILPLIEFVLSRLETVTTLVLDNRIWDAEIILRSALETFTKFLFITTADKEEQNVRINEYWNSLAEISSIKQSSQAKRNLEHFGDSEIHRLAYLPMVLPEEEEAELRKKWTKAERRKVEQKWSFTEMILSISKNYRGKPFEMIVALTHSYRMSSHVMHGDETGISIINERESRSQADYEIATNGHYLRLLSDSFIYCAFIAIETMDFLNLEENKKFFFDNEKSLEDINELVQKYHGKVFEDPDYDKYKTKE
ncbi:hypothetical protein CW731_05405 [Polaribacter sp. ALD11]|uniref:hypothetical protein n=1 Tax=Polaribacter sp. ALD11 TaxID=2058137 RepID=UPI000C302CAB|nr:hypothetical protein [Polaribacter sp. ALD11]AUC84763.1 hypothetical protein CW731_05405 [Polaribacter sp. ALD11]